MSGYGFWLGFAIYGRGSWCVCVAFDFSCTLLFSSGCWGGCPLARAPWQSCNFLVGLPVAWGCEGVAVGRISPPPSFFLFFWLRGGVVVLGRVWLCGVRHRLSRSWATWSPSPLPLLFGLRLVFFFGVAGGPPLLRWVVRWRVRGVLFLGPSAVVWLCWAAAFGSVSPGRAGWSSGVLSGGPLGVAFGVAWLGELPAYCGVGVRLRGCVTVCRPTYTFFFLFRGARVRGWVGGLPLPCFIFLFFTLGRVCLFLPLRSLGWCTHWSTFGVAAVESLPRATPSRVLASAGGTLLPHQGRRNTEDRRNTTRPLILFAAQWSVRPIDPATHQTFSARCSTKNAHTRWTRYLWGWFSPGCPSP